MYYLRCSEIKYAMKKIEMVDLASQYERLKADIDSAISGVVNSTAFIKGPDVRLFEEEL